MDLGAFGQIEELSEIAQRNGIDCPRLRGYRLMKDEEPIDFDKWKKDGMQSFEVSCLYELIRSRWVYNNWFSDYCSGTDKNIARYIKGDLFDENSTVRWDRIHGRRRKLLKTAIHNDLVLYKRQYEVWNKYAGRSDVLYIHARIGGGNWPYYYREVVDKPWFIEKVDDAADSSYCDIYARIFDGGI